MMTDTDIQHFREMLRHYEMLSEDGRHWVSTVFAVQWGLMKPDGAFADVAREQLAEEDTLK